MFFVSTGLVDFEWVEGRYSINIGFMALLSLNHRPFAFLVVHNSFRSCKFCCITSFPLEEFLDSFTTCREYLSFNMI